LDTALGVLESGFVIVGNLPNVRGMIGQGSLQILDAKDEVVSTLTDSKLLDGPWELAIHDEGDSRCLGCNRRGRFSSGALIGARFEVY
jgi:hypothetical protein